MSGKTAAAEVDLDEAMREPGGKRILNLFALGERWEIPDLNELKRIIKSQDVPYFTMGRPAAKKVHWDKVRFRLDAIERWEDANQCVYVERGPAPRQEGRPKSMLRCKRR